MNIILISNSRNRSFKIVLKPFTVYLLMGIILVSGGLFYYSGYNLAQSRSVSILKNAQIKTTSIWEDEINQQGNALDNLKINTEKSLDAMAGRLSILQGYIMRIDALGSRLASMANLEDMEFGVENPPGLGGPIQDSGESQLQISELLSAFDQMEYLLKDRTEKLTAMESMLINRNLQEQTSPGGKPALGGYLSSLFGYRTDPMSGKKEFHEGLDFAGKLGTPVVAVAAGIVTWSGIRYGYGNMIEVNHGNGYITRYAHNNKNLVSVGEKVERTEVIATMGNTGRSTGTHVHFEVIYNGRHVDPKKYLSAK
ncbi:MAG: murein DD-endopeptidase MepM/ murein hydrolase activator NlpD [Gammaproteobacteria bacterium]|jgi:murein DD-endopeptidase MepM/ murein hydrolase activator NlpD